MPGPHDATGIKILTTDESEHPRVNEIGMAIPTGSHAFVGIGVVVVSPKRLFRDGIVKN